MLMSFLAARKAAAGVDESVNQSYFQPLVSAGSFLLFIPQMYREVICPLKYNIFYLQSIIIYRHHYQILSVDAQS